MKRVLFNLMLLASIFYTPWWVATPLALLGAFLFSSYYEIFIFGLLVDLLFGTRSSVLHGTVGLMGGLFLYMLGELGKKIIRPAHLL